MAILLLFSCDKDKDSFDRKKAFKGTYIGARKSHTATFEEVFTSPNTSHFEWVYDSVSQNPDTLIISEISADSFSIQGNVAKHLPSYWQHHSWTQSSGYKGAFVYSRSLFSTGYLENLSITFQPDNKSVKVDYSYQTDYNNSELTFEGEK